MESFKIEGLNFTYPDKTYKALNDISFTVKSGEFVLVCGMSGCGKTTLLRLLKSSLSPYGKKEGSIYFNGKNLDECSTREQASGIGFVMQNPDNQIATDKVWHELSFGLENLGAKQSEISTRVSEMASFFGIETWFYKDVSELSGGQKQLLNLASIMVMQPSVLILDEPTSQLDPIAAGEFLKTLEKINREIGTTVILTEHRLEEAFPIADRVIVMDEGKIIANDAPMLVGKILKEKNHNMYFALPTPVRVHGAVANILPCPLTVRDGRAWLSEYSKTNTLNPQVVPKDTLCQNCDTTLEVKDIWFRYKKDLPDVVKGFNLKVNKGELFCLMGGNGTGKTTVLSIVSGINKPYRGQVLIKGTDISKTNNLYGGMLAVLPQNPQSLFVKKTVYLDLYEAFDNTKLSNKQKHLNVQEVATLCQIQNLLNSHPYDLSGGEQQRVALAKILLLKPQILLLDEPTKGMDAHFKSEFANILLNLKNDGVTILMVSHDIEFCAEYADKCALVFDGKVASINTPREFFKGKSFYTTSANRMARTILPDAVLADDIIKACGGSIKKQEKTQKKLNLQLVDGENNNISNQKLSPFRKIMGSIFALLFLVTSLYFAAGTDVFGMAHTFVLGISVLHLTAIGEFALACFCLFKQKAIGIEVSQVSKPKGNLAKRTLVSAFLILILIPITIYVGVFYLYDRKYYFISLLIILEILIPFFMVFESQKPKAREIVIISVLCTIAVMGRTAFFMLPQFKPVVALVIISGICFGGESGFLVGAVTGFVSNFFFGQGPWTPWQMFAFGIIGFVSGIIFKKGFLKKTKFTLCTFGFLATLVIYGGIMNPASIVMWQNKITTEMLVSAYAMGLPFDIVHAISTSFFLWFIAVPMIEKLERIKLKYGLIER